MAGVFYSVRMRASRGGPHESGGRHISGAERIVPERSVSSTAGRLLDRARRHALGEPDFISVTVERLRADEIESIDALPVTTLALADPAAARAAARGLLGLSGVGSRVADHALDLLHEGPGPGGTVMRGAAVIDAVTGRRLDLDPARGIRVSRADWRVGARRRLDADLRRAGVGDGQPLRVLEALVIASKAVWAGVRAEVCCSDDPDYLTGYVASARIGYVRLPHFKPPGRPVGGRILFVDGDADVDLLQRRLEEVPVLLGRPGPVRFGEDVDRFLARAGADSGRG